VKKAKLIAELLTQGKIDRLSIFSQIDYIWFALLCCVYERTEIEGELSYTNVVLLLLFPDRILNVKI